MNTIERNNYLTTQRLNEIFIKHCENLLENLANFKNGKLFSLINIATSLRVLVTGNKKNGGLLFVRIIQANKFNVNFPKYEFNQATIVHPNSVTSDEVNLAGYPLQLQNYYLVTGGGNNEDWSRFTFFSWLESNSISWNVTSEKIVCLTWSKLLKTYAEKNSVHAEDRLDENTNKLVDLAKHRFGVELFDKQLIILAEVVLSLVSQLVSMINPALAITIPDNPNANLQKYSNQTVISSTD